MAAIRSNSASGARKAARENAEARARVVAAGLIEWLNGLGEVIHPAAECFERHSVEQAKAEEALKWRRRLNQVYVPSDSQFLEVAVVMPDSAALLARARPRIWQARSCLEDKNSLTGQEFGKAALELNAASRYLDRARTDLEFSIGNDTRRRRSCSLGNSPGSSQREKMPRA